MANLETKRNRRGVNIKVHFTLNRERRKLCLGSKYTRKQAEDIKVHVEDIVRAKETGGRLPRSTISFISDMTADLRQRFESCGLVERKHRLTNGELWDTYLADFKLKRKRSTVITVEQVERRFFDFYKRDSEPDGITADSCERFKAFLKESEYAAATIALTITRIKSVYRWAVNREYIDRNPFRFVEIDTGSFENPDKMFFVSLQDYGKLLEACPNQTWRTVIALCRIGGLRHTSETSRLTWGDVNWEQNKLVVHSPKTERHRGKATRIIPLFPKLREELENQFVMSKPGGSPFIIPDGETYFAWKLTPIIRKAGLQPWPRTFQNLRESRANELWSEFPDHVAQAWMGHSKNTANKFYLQVKDAHFQQAIQNGTVDLAPRQTHFGDVNGGCIRM